MQRQSGTAVCEKCSVRLLPSQRRAHAVPGSEETRWKRAGIVWRQTVYVEWPGGIMCGPDGIISSILIMVAGPASVDQLMSCDCIESLFFIQWPGFRKWILWDCCFW